MNHRIKYIYIWHGASLGPGDSSLFKWNEVPGFQNGHALKGRNYLYRLIYIAKTLKKTTPH